jgi:transcriptional regulator with XRE-family HTH domain
MTTEHSAYEDLARERRSSSEYRQGYAEAQQAFLIGQAVRERRAALGLSQVELAARAGMTQPALSRLEAGGVVPTIPLLERISIALDADLIVKIAPHAALSALSRAQADQMERTLHRPGGPQGRWPTREMTGATAAAIMALAVGVSQPHVEDDLQQVVWTIGEKVVTRVEVGHLPAGIAAKRFGDAGERRVREPIGGRSGNIVFPPDRLVRAGQL